MTVAPTNETWVPVAHPLYPGWLFDVAFLPNGLPVGFTMKHDWVAAPAEPVLTARLLRRLPLGEIQEAARRGLMKHSLAPLPPEHWEKVFVESPRPGRAGRGNLELAQVSSAYLRQVAGGSSSPTHDLARDMNISPGHLRNLLGAARRRGLLTAPQSGKAGGELTAKALTLLSGESEG